MINSAQVFSQIISPKRKSDHFFFYRQIKMAEVALPSSRQNGISFISSFLKLNKQVTNYQSFDFKITFRVFILIAVHGDTDISI